jgi:hypothetical protein
MIHFKVFSSINYFVKCCVKKRMSTILMKLMILKTFYSVTLGLILDLEFLMLLPYIHCPRGGVECRGQSMELQV